MGNHESLLDAGTSQQPFGLDSCHLHTTSDIELTAQLFACIHKLAAQRLAHVDILFGEEFRFTGLITQRHFKKFHFALSFCRNFHLIVGAVACNALAERSLVVDGDAVDVGQDVTLADARLRGCTTLLHRADVDTANLLDAGLLATQVDEVLIDDIEADAKQGTLHHTILLQIDHHLLHDGLRHGKRIADVAARLRLNQGVDTHQLATRIDKRTTRVTGVDGRIGLDETLDREVLGVVRQRTQRACLGTHDTGRDGRLQVVGRTDGQHPLTQTQGIRRAKGKRRQPLFVNLQQGDIRGRILADELGIVGATVVELHAQLRSTIHHMVVRHDVAILRDDHTRATRLALAVLGLRLTTLAITLRNTEELEEGIVAKLTARGHLDTLHGLDIDDRLDGILGRIGQVGVLRLLVGREVGAELCFVLGRGVDILNLRGHLLRHIPGRHTSGNSCHGSHA